MHVQQQTQVGSMRIRPKGMPAWEAERSEPQPSRCEVAWMETPPPHRGDQLMRNLAVAAALLLLAVTLRAGAIPELGGAADVVLAAATGDSLLDDHLGRLSFVSALFPEATLVFGESGRAVLAEPVSGGLVVHAWSATEPYMTWRSMSAQVCASAAGEVIGVYHGNGGERLVQVMGSDGMACLYGNLGLVQVRAGDAVQAGDALGQLMPGRDCVLEVRRNGVSVDPALYLGQL